MTALHLAASKGSVVVVETLLTMANIEIELEDATGRTPLHWGCVSGSVGVVTRLLQYGASETAVDKEGCVLQTTCLLGTMTCILYVRIL